MGHAYRAVGWNRQKRLYDAWLALAIAAFLALYVGVSLAVHADAALDTALLRGLGAAAYVLLHVVLSVGPLARLAPRTLPLLYNRRHMGVACFALGAAHATFVVLQYHALGVRTVFDSVLESDRAFGGLAGAPFQLFGVAGLAVLFAMAATSHDFWLATLGAPRWKRLHMLVYLAWAALTLHVALGFLDSERAPALALLCGAGIAWVIGLHLAAGWRERARDRERARRDDPKAGAGGRFVDVCALEDIREGRAHVVTLAGERVAIFRYDGKLAALSNVCQHQNGPLGEGRVLEGCVTCPWHGYQYRPETGCSPAPFRERVPTFRVKASGGRVLVDPAPVRAGIGAGVFALPAGHDAALRAGESNDASCARDDFYVGYLPRGARAAVGSARAAASLLTLAALGAAALAAALQRSWQPARFEFGTPRELAGVYCATPVPSLRVRPPGQAQGAREAAARWLLVQPGKRGGDPAWSGLDGRAVTLRGALAFRAEGVVVEVEPGSLRASRDPAATGASTAPAALAAAGAGVEVRDLQGEIVDSKCWMGVMNPGNLRTHRACASLCIEGGIPPLFVVREADGRAQKLLLVGPEGESLNREVLPWVALPVSISGRLERVDDLWVLRAAPADILPVLAEGAGER